MQIADGGEPVASTVLQPKAEAEVAFIMRTGVDGADITPEAVAVGEVTAAIEIVDSRIADWKITFADTVADNGSSAYYVLGQALRPLEGLDPWSCGMVLEVDGRGRLARRRRGLPRPPAQRRHLARDAIEASVEASRGSTSNPPETWGWMSPAS